MGAVDDGGLQGEENGSSGWWQWQFMVVKNFKFFFVPNELKSAKNQHVFSLFLSIKGGWVGQILNGLIH